MPLRYHELGVQIDPGVDVPGPREMGAVQSRLLNFLNVRYLLLPPGDVRDTTVAVAQQDIHGSGLSGIVGPIWRDTRPGQTFRADRNNMNTVRVRGATYGRSNTGSIIFHLKDSLEAPTDIATVQVEAATLPDNHYWEFTFPPIPDSRDRSFYFYLESPDAPEDKAVSVYYTPEDRYPGGSRTNSGQPLSGDLAFAAVAPIGPDDPWLARAIDGGTNRMTILENKQVLPRAWLTHRTEVQSNREARLQRLKEVSFDPLSTVMLETGLPQDFPVPPASFTGESVEITNYQAETVEIKTSSIAPGMLVLADQAFPGWVAFVDGRETPIFTAYHTLRAVYVPGGDHDVRFEYRPVSVQIGAVISLGSLLVLALLPVLGPLLRRRGRVTYEYGPAKL
jgi:hypothetical protein